MVKSHPVLKTSISGKMCALLRRYRKGQGFESRTSLNFFQAFFSQLQKLCGNIGDEALRDRLVYGSTSKADYYTLIKTKDIDV